MRVSLPAEAGDLNEYFQDQGHTREDFDALEREFASVTEARILERIAKKDYDNPALTFLTLKEDFFALYNSIPATERTPRMANNLIIFIFLLNSHYNPKSSIFLLRLY